MTDNKLQKKVKNEVAKDFREAITELENKVAELYKNTDFEQKGKWQKLAGIK